MAQNFDKVVRRKENIESIEPLLSALRTISLANWRSALNRIKELSVFTSELESIYSKLLTKEIPIPSQRLIKKQVYFIFGSNRGLCGNFNHKVIELHARKGIGRERYQEIFLIGARLIKLFKQPESKNIRELKFPDIQEIHELSHSLALPIFENTDQTSVSIIYNKYMGASRYSTTSEVIYPIENNSKTAIKPIYSDTIIDTDPKRLSKTIKFALFTINLEQCFFSSLAAESAARFTNMENAGKNVEELINELEVLIQDHRRGKITTETQELAIASGLLGNK